MTIGAGDYIGYFNEEGDLILEPKFDAYEVIPIKCTKVIVAGYVDALTLLKDNICQTFPLKDPKENELYFHHGKWSWFRNYIVCHGALDGNYLIMTFRLKRDR